MRITSSLAGRAGPRVLFKRVERVASGTPAVVRVWCPEPDRLNAPDAARALGRRHLPLAEAHRAMMRLLEGKEIVLSVPMVEDFEALRMDLEAAFVASVPLEQKAAIPCCLR